MIVLDKNHPPSAVSKTIDAINKVINANNRKNFNIVKVALVPEMVETYHDYPFSISFLVQCYLRCLHRDDHETLSN